MDGSNLNLPRIAAQSGAAAIEFQSEVASTNDWAIQLAADEFRAWPLLVLASRQTGGRGRGVNRWWSSEGALTFSLVVDAANLSLALNRWPQIALVTGLAVCESLHALYPAGNFGLKWPNDVYLNGRKLCGILVEAPSHRGRVVIGVGINVNNSFVSAPAELRETATSLSDASNDIFDLSDVLIAVIQRMGARLSQLGSAFGFSDEFSRYCLLTGRNVQIQLGREAFVGHCSGIDRDGALCIATSQGPQRLHSGSVISWD